MGFKVSNFYAILLVCLEAVDKEQTSLDFNFLALNW